MRIHNKYIRNRHFRAKHWKRIRNQSHPFETFCPYDGRGNEGYYHNTHYFSNDVDAQVKRHFDWITQQARAIENGGRTGHNAPKWFRKCLNKTRQAQAKNILTKVMLGDYDAEFPKFKRDANWLYF